MKAVRLSCRFEKHIVGYIYMTVIISKQHFQLCNLLQLVAILIEPLVMMLIPSLKQETHHSITMMVAYAAE